MEFGTYCQTSEEGVVAQEVSLDNARMKGDSHETLVTVSPVKFIRMQDVSLQLG